MSAQLILDNVSVAYDNGPVVRDVSLTLEKGGIGCLLGPSGCGKTSLLRAVAGFEPVAAGEVRLGGGTVSRVGDSVPPESRNVGMVFQDFALFPHLTVAGNVGFGLRRLAADQRRGRVEEILRLVDLADSAEAYPHQLSGGQQQRVAVARAMAPRPDILLLDEPFSSIDADLRTQLATDIRAVLKQEGATAILVTHDQAEAFAMADRVAVLNDGRLLQWDSAYDIYHRPKTRFVADFIGLGVLLPGRATEGVGVEIDLGTIPGDLPDGCRTGETVDVLLRPDDLAYDGSSHLQLEIVDKVFRGANHLYTLALPGGGTALCLVPSHHDHPVGDRLGVRLAVDHLTAFAAGSSGATGF